MRVPVRAPSRHADYPGAKIVLGDYAVLVTVEGIGAVLAKLERARFHADQFSEKWAQFAASNVYTITTDREVPWTVHLTWTYRPDSPETQATLIELSLIYADLLGNLRATLDYLAWQLVLAAGNTPTDKTGFPAARKRADFNSLRSQKLRGVKGRWVDLIESTQPYNAYSLDDDMFFILDHNNNIAKHQAMPITIFSVDTTRRPLSFRMSHPEMPGRSFQFENLLDEPIEAGNDLFRITADPPIPDLVVTPAEIPARIKFEDGLTHAVGLDYTNRDLIQWVADAVAKFEPAFAPPDQ
jgi:hypothetical protein